MMLFLFESFVPDFAFDTAPYLFPEILLLTRKTTSPEDASLRSLRLSLLVTHNRKGAFCGQNQAIIS